MNKLRFFAVTVALTGSIAVFAQNADERKSISQSTNAANLLRLSAEFQNELEVQEARVQQYLSDNPKKTRSFSKDNSVYYLSRIGSDGNPLYINTKFVRDNSKNAASGQLIKADQLYPGGSLGVSITGTGMVAGVWDGGLVRATHELLTGQVTNQPSPGVQDTLIAVTVGGENHMTHVAGTMVGKDLAAQPSARGIAFGGTARAYDWGSDKPEMVMFAAEGFLISNHSYGLANDNTVPVWQFGAYDSEARQWDVIAKNAPRYLPFVAGGNEQTANGNMTKAGYDLMTGSSAAKNVITVGAINGDKTMSAYSNWGPTDDGRVKPDIVAKGTGINSAQAYDKATPPVACNNCYSGNGADSSGTSYATPAAAAGGLLLQQYYKSLNPAYMLSSTLKALMLGTAEDLGQPGPDHKFGWGLLNVEAAANAVKKNGPVGINSKGSAILEHATNPAADSTTEETLTLFAKGGVPLVVNMGWLDNEGPEQVAADGVDPTATRLVYDFDMMVRNVATSVDVRPWKIPSMANRTSDATISTIWFDDNRNNFRQIIIGSPVADGQYTLFIRKKAGSPPEARTLSFVITGLKESVAGPSVLNVDGSDAATRYGAATDGVLILRYLLGFRGAELTNGALGGSPTRDAAQIATYLGGLGTQLDVDGDGQVHAFTDGLLILRRMLGLSGPALTAGVKLGTRTDNDIANAIDLLRP